jgi:putative endonuclease
MFYVYVLQSDKNGHFYTGYTSNLKDRIKEHNLGISKSTSYRQPLTLVYYEASLNRKDALRRENYLKTTWGKRYIKNRIRNYMLENKDSDT